MSTPLTFTHLRFRARAEQTLHLGGYQSAQRLRDGLASVMMNAVCTHTPRGQKPDPEHAATCPACWMLLHEAEAGEARRSYSLVGPQPPLDILEAGQEFHFTLTLFGRGYDFLSYFVLSAAALGEVGVGPRRGRFRLIAIEVVHPLRGEARTILGEGENIVRPQALSISWEDALQAAQTAAGNQIHLRFLSPTRLIEEEKLVKVPDFGIFFRHLLKRIDDLARQHNQGQRRPPEEVEELQMLADQVRIVDQRTEWVDLHGPSQTHHPRRPVPMGGFVGEALYRLRHLEPLLPWLIFGQGVQVGKLTSKGNGVFQIVIPGKKGYWL
ncbi:MAG: CRISPR system precrRNA processing endoribonuclease RAMP protein Cas6 [Anaerolineales bacterium]